MVVAAVVALLLAALIGGSGAWTLLRRTGDDINTRVMRLVAPPQLAAAVMLGAGGAIGLSAPTRVGLPALLVGVIGAVATVAAGSWQGARYAARQEASAGCGSAGGCAGCTKTCSAD